MCLPFDSRQYASAFDQPLSFDTSKVTTIYQMFVHASAFNQPLSFDTSKVTTMYAMFRVRSARVLTPALSRVLFVRASMRPESDIHWMFSVRSAPALVPNPLV